MGRSPAASAQAGHRRGARSAPSARDQLTPQEAQIAGPPGRPNRRSASAVPVRATVEWHLSKVFTKLEISSRRQLEQALPDRASAGPLA
jgi:DNA-binding NarL/FixJ family response regulator